MRNWKLSPIHHKMTKKTKDFPRPRVCARERVRRKRKRNRNAAPDCMLRVPQKCISEIQRFNCFLFCDRDPAKNWITKFLCYLFTCSHFVATFVLFFLFFFFYFHSMPHSAEHWTNENGKIRFYFTFLLLRVDEMRNADNFRKINMKTKWTKNRTQDVLRSQ